MINWQDGSEEGETTERAGVGEGNQFSTGRILEMPISNPDTSTKSANGEVNLEFWAD